VSTRDIDDPFELRAQHAAQAAHQAVRGIEMSGLASRSVNVPVRLTSRALLIAAAVILVLVVGGTFARGVLTRNEGIPAFEPRPMAGARPFHAQLQPHVTFQVPVKHTVSSDTAGITVVRFDDIPEGALIAMRVRSYAAGDQANLVAAVAADSRLQVLHRMPTTVGGEGATRLVVRPVPGTSESPWFCPVGDKPCFDLNPTGQSTLYLFRHDGARYLIAGGAVNDSGSGKLQHIVDGAAATWQW
jgi:hypothetical protein